jgi:DNA-binding CsgD family transcriptional regulator
MKGLLHATTVSEIGRLAMDAAQRSIGYSSGQFAPLANDPRAADGAVYRCSVGPVEAHLQRFIEIFPDMERELLSLSALFALDNRSCNLQHLLSERAYRNTRVYNEYMRPFRVEREIVAALGTPRQPLGFIASSRSAAEPGFSDGEQRTLESIRDCTERAIQGLQATRYATGDLQRILSAIEHGLPMASLLFDDQGHLLWLSQEAVLRLGLISGSIGSTRIVSRNSQLDALRSIAAWTARDPARALACRQRWPTDLLAPGEDLIVRVISHPCEPVYILLSIVTQQTAPSERTSLQTLRGLGLAAREAEVAQLAAQGYSVTDMAARLNIKQSTVQSHLRHIYHKLSVSSRVELTWKLLTARQKAGGEGPAN